MTRIRLDIAYDGTDFHGWARQPGLRSVQQTLEDALARIVGPRVAAPRLVVAGRTDAGVHARGQVAHLDLDADLNADLKEQASDAELAARLLRKLRGILARQPDVFVHAATPVPDEFDARYSAIWRRYEYRISDRPATHDPARRRNTLWLGNELDARAMNDVAASLLGFHDWAAFCRPREGATTLRTLTEFSWQRDDEGTLVARVAADAFCHNMVRYLVGASIAVGTGKLTREEVLAIRESRQHANAVVVVAPHGLTLLEIGYPEPEQFAAQAERAMARRTPSDEM